MATTFCYYNHPCRGLYQHKVFICRGSRDLQGLQRSVDAGDRGGIFAAALSAQVEAESEAVPRHFDQWTDRKGRYLRRSAAFIVIRNWVADGITVTKTITTTTYENIAVLKIPKSSDAIAFTIELSGRHPRKRRQGFELGGHALDPNNKAPNGRVYDPVVPSDDRVQSVDPRRLRCELFRRNEIPGTAFASAVDNDTDSGGSSTSE